MKKHIIFGVCLLLSLGCVACAGKKTETQSQTTTESAAETTTQAQSTQTSEVQTSQEDADVVKTDLTEEQIKEYTEFLNDKGNNGFLMSSYEDPSSIDLNQVFYSGAGIGKNPTEAQVQAYNRALGKGTQKDTDQDIFYLTSQQLNDFLKEKTGYTFAELGKEGNDSLRFTYVAAQDAYFNTANDTNNLVVSCKSGYETSDGMVILTYASEDDSFKGQVTLKKSGDTLLFVSNKEEGVSEYEETTKTETETK